MKYLSGIMLVSFLAASLSGAALPKNQAYGEYVEARTADVYTGPCFANGEVGFGGDMAVFGWKVQKGNWQGVTLDGLSVVAAIRASHTLGDPTRTAYPVKSILIVDERAGLEQRQALKSFAQRLAGDLLQDIVRVEYRPIDFKFDDDNVHSMKALVTAGELARIQTRPIGEGDHICHNEDVYYSPLTKLDHAMPAVASAHTFRGKGLNANWSSPDKRSAFVGTFNFQE
ncbi:MAG TPA: DUF1326 domain-containing protein [Bryobacteraceae bacterium]|nr:DUF1326 domain-containing protein [Bryobacteraceae bacterium]